MTMPSTVTSSAAISVRTVTLSRPLKMAQKPWRG
jgi:hypothetical protein